jgi:adenosylcobinamide-GDP ribazoletransferase
LTRLPVGLPVGLPGGRTGSAAFGLVGTGLGVVGAIPAILLADAAPLLGAMLALGTMGAASGFLHLDGLADTADALAAPNPARAEAARTDPRIGTAGAAAIVITLGASAGALVAIPGAALFGAIVVAGAASRAVPALAAPVARRTDGRSTGFGAWFTGGSGPGGAVVSVATAGIVTALAAGAGIALAPGPGGLALAQAAVAPVAGLLGGLAIGLLVLAGLGRRFGGLVGDHYGASVELAFLAALGAQAVTHGVGA